MSDPNADLIGYTFTDAEGRALTVLGSSVVGGYVEVASEGYCSVRPAAQLRRHRALSR